MAEWNQTLWPDYGGYPVLGDINYVDSELTEGFDRHGVTVIDNKAGVLYQLASTDRSRPKTVKTWWTNYASDIWPIRQLMHYLCGSQGLFWLPTNRNDLILQQQIATNASSLVVSYVGYSIFGLDVDGNPMLPFAHLRITLTNGTQYYSAISGASTSFGSVTETINLGAALPNTNPIPISSVLRVEFLNLCRIADDTVKFTHDIPGRAEIVINCVGVRQ